MQLRIFTALIFIALVPMMRIVSRWLFTLALDTAGMTVDDAARVRQEHMMSRRPHRYVQRAIIARSFEKAKTRRTLALYTYSNFAVSAMAMLGCTLSLVATLAIFDKLLILLIADIVLVLAMTAGKAVYDIRHGKSKIIPILTTVFMAVFAVIAVFSVHGMGRDIVVIPPEAEIEEILKERGYELEKKGIELRAEKDGVLVQIYVTDGGESTTSVYNQVRVFVLGQGDERTEKKKGNMEGVFVETQAHFYTALRADRTVIYAGCTLENRPEVEELLSDLGIK